jgi:hypothetical protein
MAGKRPRERLPPESLLEFFELEPFVRRWEKYGFPDEELGNLEIEIMAGPRSHPVIQGTRGLRKMRYSPASWPKGKSGALRVCYVYFEHLGAVALVIVYAKNEMDDIPESMKPSLNKAIDEIEEQLGKLFSQEKG